MVASSPQRRMIPTGVHGALYLAAPLIGTHRMGCRRRLPDRRVPHLPACPPTRKPTAPPSSSSRGRKPNSTSAGYHTEYLDLHEVRHVLHGRVRQQQVTRLLRRSPCASSAQMRQLRACPSATSSLASAIVPSSPPASLILWFDIVKVFFFHALGLWSCATVPASARRPDRRLLLEVLSSPPPTLRPTSSPPFDLP